jgi:cytochrome b561
MNLRSTPERWGSAIKTLHWVIALLIIVLACVGWWMKGLPNSPDKIKVYALHKSVGLTVLALVVLRVLWRLQDRRPPPLPMPRWQYLASEWTHVGLYAAMFVMPLSGWLFNSAANFPLKWFNLFAVPRLATADPELKAFAGAVHWWTFWVISGLFALHVAGALKHHFVDRDEVLRRMLPCARPPAVPALVAAAPEPAPAPPVRASDTTEDPTLRP